MTEFLSEYAQQLQAAVKQMSIKLEEAFFFGIIRDRHECRCHCHNVAVTSDRDGPYCAVTRKPLYFADVYDAPLPDLIFPNYTGPLPESYELWKDEETDGTV